GRAMRFPKRRDDPRQSQAWRNFRHILWRGLSRTIDRAASREAGNAGVGSISWHEDRTRHHPFVTRFRLTIEYDGSPFMGWQRQAHGPSVQQAIEEAIEAITDERVTLHAAGRTDTGVHALAMTAH